MDNVEDECLRIENMINDSIDPAPSYKIEVEKIDEKTIIILNVVKVEIHHITTKENLIKDQILLL